MTIKKTDVIAPFLKQAKQLYEFMDQKYDDAALIHQFNCSGCPDNCCMTHFYHHTFFEYFYLIEAYKQLPDQTKLTIFKKAKQIQDQISALDENETRPRMMCPLNMDGLCALYESRPMICRLHGIPYEIKRGHQSMQSPGCGEFDNQTSHSKTVIFDRTPIYIKMAGLENSLKKALGISKKNRMTVADMIIAHEESYKKSSKPESSQPEEG